MATCDCCYDCFAGDIFRCEILVLLALAIYQNAHSNCYPLTDLARTLENIVISSLSQPSIHIPLQVYSGAIEAVPVVATAFADSVIPMSAK
eukprot:5213961-Lingulodinium_polyedra.AAC.1